jgi:hypothetical protein
MALMSKNKPTKRIEFDGGFVELQHLSKGIKDEYQSRMAALAKELGDIDEEKIKSSKESGEIPKEFNADSVLRKVNEAEYYKLSKAIKSWSEQEEINDQTVRELDGEVFAKISSAIDEMNELRASDKKN